MPQLQAWQMWSRRPVEEVSATLVVLLQKNLWIKDFVCHSFNTILRMFLNQVKFDNGLWKFSNIMSRLQISKGFFYSSSNHWKKARGLSAIKIKPAILVLCFVQQQNPPEDQSALWSVQCSVFSVLQCALWNVQTDSVHTFQDSPNYRFIWYKQAFLWPTNNLKKWRTKL